jgi:ferredoxin-NADP reductase
MTELKLVVTGKYACADDVVAIELADADGRVLPAWTPGAHIEMDLAPGLTRRYSLAGGNQETWRLAVLREPHGRGGSRHIHEHLQIATTLAARGPYNHFELHDADRYIFIAGGIGITPILPMVHTVATLGTQFSLLYGGRQRTSMAFLGELSRYGRQVIVHPHDEAGPFPLDQAVAGMAAGTLVYCCGPTGLLDAVRARAQSWPDGTLHLEQFRTDADGDGFTVHLAGSGMTLAVPRDKSILDVVEEAGVAVMSSCRSGTCGTCETPVLGGTVEHRDTVLTDDERRSGQSMMICVSRSVLPTLTLDL